MAERERYCSYKAETTTVAVSIDTHDVLKVYAAVRDLTMREAVDNLLRKALMAEYVHE